MSQHFLFLLWSWSFAVVTLVSCLSILHIRTFEHYDWTVEHSWRAERGRGLHFARLAEKLCSSFFAVLIYSAQPRKLKLKGLHADVKRHFCSTINLNYLMFYTHGQRDFLTMYLNSIWHLWPLTFFLTLLRPRIDKFNFYRQHRHSKITSKCCFDTMRLYEMGIKFRMLRM